MKRQVVISVMSGKDKDGRQSFESAWFTDEGTPRSKNFYARLDPHVLYWHENGYHVDIIRVK